jgi:hypothetical protein
LDNRALIPGWIAQNSMSLLIVALLLAIWLLLRVRRHEEARRRPVRRAPTSLHELGHVLFEVLRSADLDGYRGLFLVGGEAAQVFGAGDGAAAWLSRHTRDALRSHLVRAGRAIPEGARYDGIEQTAPDTYAIWIAPPAGERFLLRVGTAVRVGAIYRLKELPDDEARPSAQVAGPA